MANEYTEHTNALSFNMCCKRKKSTCATNK